MIVIDADVLGRRRTGDETYVRELLRALPRDLDLAAVTRRPDLVPEGVRAIELDVGCRSLRRMARPDNGSRGTRLARQIATIDVLSRARFGIGICQQAQGK